MNKLTKNLILPAAALAALLLAPKADAAWRVAGGVRFGPPGYGYRGAVVVRPAVPFRVVGGVRFYGSCPGPGYVWVNEGWAWPPYAGAAWIPGHYNRFGVWIRGHWRG